MRVRIFEDLNVEDLRLQSKDLDFEGKDKNILVCFLSVHSVYTLLLLYGWHVLFLLASLGPLGAHSIFCFPSTCYLTMKLKRDAALQTDSRIFLVFNSIILVHFCEQLIYLAMPII